MNKSFSSEIGYRLLATEDIDPYLEERLLTLLTSDKPVELMVHYIRPLLKHCIEENGQGCILREKLLENLESVDPCLHDIDQLREAIRSGLWPSNGVPTADMEWNEQRVPKHLANPAAIASRIAADMEQVRLSPRTVFLATCELADVLDSYRSIVPPETADVALRLINLGVLFSKQYNMRQLADLIIAFDKMFPYVDETFAFFSKESLYEKMIEKIKDGVSQSQILRVCKALSLSADAYIVKGLDEPIDPRFAEYEHIIEANRQSEASNSKATRDLIQYCLEQLQTHPDIFDRRDSMQILEYLCDFKCGGFDVDPVVAARFMPENFRPQKLHDLLVLSWSQYIFEDSLSDKQRKDLEENERELQERFNANVRKNLSISACEEDAQRYLQKNYGHLNLHFNTWLYGFERDCLVEVPYGEFDYINFEIDGHIYHRLRERKDAIMNFISKKKNVKMVRIEKIPGFATRKESRRETYRKIDEELRFYRKHD